MFALLFALCSILQLAFSAFLTGLIWVIQVLHYPGFSFVPPEQSLRFHGFHTNRITWIVAPLMIAELITAGLPLLLPLGLTWIWVLNFTSVVGVWLVTGLAAVPLHNRLAQDWNLETIKSLVRINWLRTWIWSARCLAWILLCALTLSNPVGLTNCP